SDIRDELENWLNHEELLWKQKSRCDWLQLEDHNTKFFHTRTVQRRKFNCIMVLCIDNGKWCSNQNILQSEAVGFLEKLYREIPRPMRGLPSNIFPRLKLRDIVFSERAIFDKEIKKALIDMDPLKAPENDGWKLGYNCYLGNCTPFEAELWGILDRLLILLNKVYKRATIQTKNLDVAKALTDKGLEDLGIIVLRKGSKDY
ncbi:hypothetical protein Goarm_006400, partial [Gossypium armourianum]|nr:hypothetical protein [Gossypium armourianum]